MKLNEITLAYLERAQASADVSCQASKHRLIGVGIGLMDPSGHNSDNDDLFVP
jgi:hypothetical protein